MYNGAPFDINNILSFPITFNNSEANIYSENNGEYNEFFFSSVSNKPIYSASGNYFLVLFTHFNSTGPAFNFLNIYDVSQSKNNVLITQY